ncbi:hypothetical protein K474DRAFT_274922 [Panus rudis PR-1116 ss-1]|nr:hypothetical protein K474DRAFT_274922 [Panus rudis PR-1116 ss-1]
MRLPNTPEHAFMMQKVYDFRHKFAEITDRAAEAQQQIGPGLPFLSLKTIVRPGRDNKDVIKRAGIYQGECLVMALAKYYKHIGVCPGDALDYPCGALGLCAVALERAFRLWLRGTYNEQAAATPIFNFKSSNYVNATRDYAASINNISDQKWEEILDLTSAVWSSEHSQEDIELGEVRAGIISDAEDEVPDGDVNY